MEELNFSIKNGSGSFNKLDKEYKKFLSLLLDNGTEIDRLEVYNLIMKDLLNHGLVNTFEEVKYRLTDGENPNRLMLEILNRETYPSNINWQIKNRINLFIEEDYLNRFK